MRKIITATLFLCIAFVPARAQWAQTNGLYTIGTIKTMATDSDYLYAGIMNNCLQYGEIHRSADAGVTWTSIATGLPVFNEAYVVYKLGNRLFACTYDSWNVVGNGIYVSFDQGNTWIQSDSGLPANSIVAAMAEHGGVLYATTCAGWYGSFYASTDSGGTWSLRGMLGSNANAWSIAFQGSDIFLGTTNGVLKSVNGGASWTTLTNGLPSGAYAQHVFTYGTNLFACVTSMTYDGLYISSNGGASWTVVQTGLTADYPVYSHISMPNVLYISADGVYASYDGGYSWANTGTNEIGYMARDSNYLYLGIQPSNGVWRAPLNTITGEIPVEQPTVGVAPNPFSSVSTVRFSVPQEHANVTIFDLTGKTIRNFNCSGTGAEIDRTGMESGLYMLRVTDDAGEISELKLVVN